MLQTLVLHNELEAGILHNNLYWKARSAWRMFREVQAGVDCGPDERRGVGAHMVIKINDCHGVLYMC